MNKTFKVAQVRDLLNQVNNEQITFSRFVEILNEQVEGQSSPKIKQLECEYADSCAKAPTQIGKYIAFELGVNYVRLYFAGTGDVVFEGTLDEAKAAAQADFEKRIKECLE